MILFLRRANHHDLIPAVANSGSSIWYNPPPLPVCGGRSMVGRFIFLLKGRDKQGPSILMLWMFGIFCLPVLPWAARVVLEPAPWPEDVRAEGREEAGFSMPCWHHSASELFVWPNSKYHCYLRHSSLLLLLFVAKSILKGVDLETQQEKWRLRNKEREEEAFKYKLIEAFEARRVMGKKMRVSWEWGRLWNLQAVPWTPLPGRLALHSLRAAAEVSAKGGRQDSWSHLGDGWYIETCNCCQRWKQIACFQFVSISAGNFHIMKKSSLE